MKMAKRLEEGVGGIVAAGLAVVLVGAGGAEDANVLGKVEITRMSESTRVTRGRDKGHDAPKKRGKT